MQYLAKSNIKGPLGPVMKGEIVDLDDKLGAAMVASGLVEPVLGSAPEVKAQNPIDKVQEAMFSKKEKKKKG